MNIKKIIPVLFSIFLISCSPKIVKIDISYDSKTQKGVLLVDGKTKIKLPADSLCILASLPEGNHTFKLNKDKEFKCYVSEEGGILNLNKERFVVISEFYGTQSENFLTDKFNERVTKQTKYLVVDSLIYIYKRDSLAVLTDFQIKSQLSLDKETNTYIGTIDFYDAKPFIDKNWDYGLTEDFPDQVEIKTSSSSSYMNNVESKTKVMQFSLFRILAFMNPDYFEIRRLKDVLSSKEDKEEDKSKEKKQLEME